MSLRTVEFVSELLNVPKARVYELVRQNILPVVRIGARQIRFDEETLNNWIKSGGAINAEDATRGSVRNVSIREVSSLESRND